MKIAFLCKRRYTGSDVISDRFGRLYEIPLQLARIGHDVRGYCLDYHQPGSGCWQHHGASPGSLWWESRSLGSMRVPGMLAYPFRLRQRLRSFEPDLLLGASDMAHVVLTSWLSRRMGIPYAIDLYDNFESFDFARLPGLVAAFRRAVRSAGFVSVVSDPLRHKVETEYGARFHVTVAPNAIDNGIFRPLDRHAARRALGLPADAQLVGTAGGLHKAKGLDVLYAAWEQSWRERPNLHLVLAGPGADRYPPPRHERVHYLGRLLQSQVATLFNALDVGVVTLRDDEFGRYCFPQKLHEMLACGLPVVAADVGVMSSLLKAAPQLLFRNGDAAGLAAVVLKQLANPLRPPVSTPDWKQVAAVLEPQLRSLVLDAQRLPGGDSRGRIP